MFKIIMMLSRGNRDKLLKIVLISAGEAIFGFVPIVVLYQIIDAILKNNFSEEILLNCGITLGIGVILRMLCSYLSVTVSRNYGTLMVKDLRLKLGEHIRKLPLGYFDSQETGELSGKLLENVNRIEMILTMMFPEMISGFVTAILISTGLFYIEPKLAWAALLTMPIAIFVMKWAKGIMAKRGKALYASSYKLVDSLIEFITGIKYVKSFNKSSSKLNNLVHHMDDFRKQSLRTEGKLSPVMVLAGIVIDAGLISIMLMGAYFLISGNIEAHTFIIFIIIGSRFFDNLKGLSVNYIKVKYLEIAGQSILDIFKIPFPTGKSRVHYQGGDISLKSVSFAYKDDPILKNINLNIRQGSMTAFVGPSGSGKSTLVNIIARFYDPQKGEIKLGNVNIKEIDPDTLLRQMSFVFQKVFLFRDTILNNIAIGKPGATEEQVIAAAKKANAHDFISKLPNGYQTLAGENGANLSGGELQRISIARAILKDAPIILLDEATASLDPENEVFIQNAIDNLLQKKTVIVIAHRLKTICHADHIVVLDQGKLSDQGTHDELLEKSNLYQNLWKKQCHTTDWQANNNEK